MIIKLFSFAMLWVIWGISFAEPTHYSCDFDGSVMVNESGASNAIKWSSKGFSIKDDMLILDKGNLKLHLKTNLESHGILRGGDYNKGYTFSLENKKFIYVSILLPLASSWTITGTCMKD